MASTRENKTISNFKAALIGGGARANLFEVELTTLPTGITWDADNPVQTTSLPKLDWTLDIAIAVIVRGDKPDEVADPVVESLHSKMMADLTLGGVATNIIPSGTSNEAVDSDQPAGIVTVNYQIKYRTSNTNLATL